MELFIKVYFWIAIVCYALRLLGIGFTAYPRKVEKWEDIVSLLISIIFILWAFSLIY